MPDRGSGAYAGLRVARLLGVAFAGDSGGSFEPGELSAGWRLFLERLAAVQPVVLVVEDAPARRRQACWTSWDYLH